jgi:hypothetical protein
MSGCDFLSYKNWGFRNTEIRQPASVTCNIQANNTPQAYPVVRRRDAQTGGFIFSGKRHAL